MEALLFGLFMVGLLVIAPIVSSISLFLRTRSLRAEADALRADVDALRERVRRLELDVVPPKGGSYESAHAARPAPSEALPPKVVVPPQVVLPPREVLPPEGGSRLPSGTQATEPPPAPTVPPLTASEWKTESESLENRIGGRWLLYIGVAAIVIGVAYFEKLAIDNNWISETARVIQGGVLGALLVGAGMWFARAGYRGYGQMIAGGGLAVMYVSTYAAFNYYRLLDRPIAFLLLVAITVLAAWLADRQNSQGLAIFAVGGGFVTPFLLPGDTDAQIVLFTYDAILIAGTVFLATRRAWPFLNVISYVFTLITVAGWFDRFYETSKYLRTELFITLFCVMFVVIARQCRRSELPAARVAAWFLWTAPAAYYLASLAILGLHAIPLLVWLIAVMLVGGILSVRVSPRIGFAIWVAVAVPLLGWSQSYIAQSWLAPGLAAVAGVYVISLASQLQIMASSERMRPVDIAWVHLNGLLMFAGAYLQLENSHLAITGGLAAAFAAWHGVIAAAVLGRWRDHALHFAGLAFSLLAIAVALQFDGPAVTVGWAAEGAAIVALGLIERRDWLRAGGLLLFVVAITRVLSLLVSVAPANHVVFLNPRAASAALIVGLSYLLAWLYRRESDVEERAFGIDAGVIIAQLVSIVWLTTEIRAYFALSNSNFTREVMISVTWGAYATALIVVGLFKRYAPIRYFGIALFALTILKVFFQDLAHLKQIYRVLSVMGLGILLLVTSYLYQRMRDKS